MTVWISIPKHAKGRIPLRELALGRNGRFSRDPISILNDCDQLHFPSPRRRKRQQNQPNHPEDHNILKVSTNVSFDDGSP